MVISFVEDTSRQSLWGDLWQHFLNYDAIFLFFVQIIVHSSNNISALVAPTDFTVLCLIFSSEGFFNI